MTVAVRNWRRLQKVDDNTFVGDCDSEHPQARVYGGHVLAQAMSAAYFTAPKGFFIHSIHCYFVRGGEEDVPIEFKVTRVRDGRNFAVRYVEAKQGGKTIHLSEYSLQKLDGPVDNFKVSPPPPEIERLPRPEELQSDVEGRHAFHSAGGDLRQMRGLETQRMAPSIDLRPTDLSLFLHGDEGKKRKQLHWMRYKNVVDSSDYMLQHSTLVYMSDMNLATTGSLVHPEKKFKLITSLDHSAWFHDYNFNVNDWMIYEQEVVSNSANRSLIYGRIWSEDGRLLMTTAQEALIYKARI